MGPYSMRVPLFTLMILLSCAVVAGTPSPKGARVYFISPANGESVTNPVHVVFGLQNMGVAPAGVNVEGTGHHHLLVDADVPPPGRPMAKDEHHLHFGGGQTETTLELSPGTHTLQLIMGDFAHTPHDPPVISERISITVE
jgi:Domain of unknown function (DUF4399)